LVFARAILKFAVTNRTDFHFTHFLRELQMVWKSMGQQGLPKIR
jgi:hypothetical protein